MVNLALAGDVTLKLTELGITPKPSDKQRTLLLSSTIRDRECAKLWAGHADRTC